MKNTLFLLVLLTAALTATSLSASLTGRPEHIATDATIADPLEQLRQRADSGEAEALYHLARLYETGYDTIPSDTIRALDLYRRAAEQGYVPAQNHYGFMIYNGHGTAADHAQGRAWMEKAAFAGDPSAANNLGWILMKDPEVDHNAENAVYWLTKAADGGAVTAMAMLGDLYAEGIGTPPDTVRAKELYTAAIEGGMPSVQRNLLMLCGKEWSQLPADEKVAVGLYYYTHRAPLVGVILFEQAANQGNAHALALMGDALTRAQGASYNHDKGLEYYFRAARCGYAPAQFVIAELLEILPDSLEALPEELKSTLTDADRDPGHWYDAARAAGVSNASEATRMLLQQ